MVDTLNTEQGIRLSAMSPRYLQSNSTSHTRPFSAVAELLDNAYDSGVSAKLVCIDAEVIKEELCLTFTDNGSGMTPKGLHRMLSFGFTDKTVMKNHQPIGVYGNGFKSGSMRLGKDAIVFTKNGGALSVGLLSQTYLERVHAQTVIVPIVPFSQQTKKIIIAKDSELNLNAILEHAFFRTKEELLTQFDAIPGKKGTRILIWNIHRSKDGKPELDFETDKYDIRIADFSSEEAENSGRKVPSRLEKGQDSTVPEVEYSLRAYCSILYFKPRMQIILRQKKVKTQMISRSLASTEYDVYKPTSVNKKVRITFGFNCKSNSHFGIMMYHNNRLIKSYEKVGCQVKGDAMGVIGVIECNFLKPAHSKQDFEENKEYRRTITALGQKLNTYWKSKVVELNLGNLDSANVTAERPDQTWVQCEECLKWRRLPHNVDPITLPEKWVCSLHPRSKYRSCSAPEEPEPSNEELNPSYDPKFRKQSPESLTCPFHLPAACPGRDRILHSQQGQQLGVNVGAGNLNASFLPSLTDQNAEKRKRRLSSLETVEHQVLAPPETCPAQNNCEVSIVKGDDKEEQSGWTAGSGTPPPTLERIGAVPMSPGPLEENILHAASKHKLSTEQELLEKRRRFQSQIEDSSPELSGPSPAFSDREISSEADQDEECRRLNDKDGMSSHLHLLGENHGKPVETSLVLPVSVAVGLCLKKDSAATPSHLEGEQKEVSVIHGELEEQMPDLVTDSPAREGPCCISAVGSVEEVDKRPFVAVVGISKAMAGREAPIQLVPLGWEERLDRPKAGGKGLSHNNPLPKESKKEDLDVPKTMDQRDRKKEEAEELRKTVENISAELKRVSAQQNLLRCKVEELEQEKSLLKTDLLKSQQELAVLRTQETGGLYWSKKHMAYHHAELQELKTKLERNLEEKTELKERLKETEMHLERLREAQTSCKSPEREDLKSTTEKLRTLRVNVSLLLMSVLPHLELPDDEPDQVDEILQTVLETNGLLRKNPMP